MLTLYTLPSAFDLVSVSPFCTKLELYLRMRDLPYRAVFGDPRTAPKRKMPYVEHGGRVISDSQHVIDVLEADPDASAIPPLDGWLDARQKAEGHVLRRALEEGFYFITFFTRWFHPASWARYAPIYYPYLPKGLGRFIMPMLRRGVGKTLAAQGTGRHSAAEIYAMGERDVAALSAILGERTFVLGESPSTSDATAFAFLSSSLDFPVTTPITEAIRSHPNLVRYHAHVRRAYLADWKPVIKDGARG